MTICFLGLGQNTRARTGAESPKSRFSRFHSDSDDCAKSVAALLHDRVKRPLQVSRCAFDTHWSSPLRACCIRPACPRASGGNQSAPAGRPCLRREQTRASRRRIPHPRWLPGCDLGGWLPTQWVGAADSGLVRVLWWYMRPSALENRIFRSKTTLFAGPRWS